MPVPAAACDESFETERRARETSNEKTINLLRAVLFLLGFLIHLTNYAWTWLPVRSPGPLVCMLGLAFAGSVVLHVYLRSDPPYHPGRKYAITIGEFALVTLGATSLSLHGSRLMSLMLSLSLYIFFVVLSGLRFSRNAVWLAGALGLLCQMGRILFLPPPENALPAALISVITLCATTAAAAFNLDSLMRLHREAVVKSRLQRFLPPELVQEVVRNPALLDQKTETMEATVLFTDIRGFTGLSERLPPEQVVEVLNLAFEEMTQAVLEEKGMLDKFIGDAMMAVFGVPVPQEDHADRALRAALSIRERMLGLNERLRQQGLPELGLGIGIHSGPLVVGAIGARQRQDYTVIGDTVNVASRVEGLTRNYETDILLTQMARTQLQGEHSLLAVDCVAVKGRSASVEIWRPEQDAVPILRG